MKQNHHVPVLLEAVLQYLSPKKRESYLDLTAGYGGHSSKVLEQTNAPGKAVLVDRDAKAVDQLQKSFPKADIRQSDFLKASQQLLAEGKRFDMILADLGVSSPHLNMASRGFSIKAEGPLDMRMDQSQGLTAAELIDTASEAELEQILREFGEEPKSRQIAKALIANRPITTTSQLANLVAKIWGGQSKIHPATRSFQALRIAVNDELGQLQDSLPLWLELLNPKGRLVVISFHSLEDRLVKQFLADHGGKRYDAELKLLTKRPVTADKTEIVFNPRARSAKLRAAAKQT